jgi:S1-C subfamily serine protease
VVSTLDYGEGEAAGTGIVLTSSGEVLTNNHVVDGATSIEVTDVGNGKTYSATVVGYDVTSDIAVLKLKDASGLVTATLGNSSTVALGQSVVGIGNAGGAGGTPSAATGTVTALGQDITAADESSGSSEQLTGLIETDADIQAGDSGGPLVNMSGQVVGVDTAGSSTFQLQPDGSQSGSGSSSDGFAIPINQAASIAKEIESGQSSSSVHIGATAFLGVEVASTSGYSGSQFGISGATIEGVVSGSPAATAGLSQGDTITSIGGRAVSSSTSLRNVLVGFHPGQKVSISWVDSSGSSHTATVDLTSGPTE